MELEMKNPRFQICMKPRFLWNYTGQKQPADRNVVLSLWQEHLAILPLLTEGDPQDPTWLSNKLFSWCQEMTYYILKLYSGV